MTLLPVSESVGTSGKCPRPRQAYPSGKQPGYSSASGAEDRTPFRFSALGALPKSAGLNEAAGLRHR